MTLCIEYALQIRDGGMSANPDASGYARVDKFRQIAKIFTKALGLDKLQQFSGTLG
jgi:hypothetical protein